MFVCFSSFDYFVFFLDIHEKQNAEDDGIDNYFLYVICQIKKKR